MKLWFLDFFKSYKTKMTKLVVVLVVAVVLFMFDTIYCHKNFPRFHRLNVSKSQTDSVLDHARFKQKEGAKRFLNNLEKVVSFKGKSEKNILKIILK